MGDPRLILLFIAAPGLNPDSYRNTSHALNVLRNHLHSIIQYSFSNVCTAVVPAIFHKILCFIQFICKIRICGYYYDREISYPLESTFRNLLMNERDDVSGEAGRPCGPGISLCDGDDMTEFEQQFNEPPDDVLYYDL